MNRVTSSPSMSQDFFVIFFPLKDKFESKFPSIWKKTRLRVKLHPEGTNLLPFISLKVGVCMYGIPEDLVGIMPKTNHHHGPMRKSKRRHYHKQSSKISKHASLTY